MTKSTTERDHAQALRDYQATRSRALIDPQVLTRYLESCDDLPQEMREAERWVGWRFEPKDDPTDKPDKVPVSFNFNGRASSTKASTWCGLDHARARLRHDYAQHTSSTRYIEGLGFTLGDGWLGIDLDNVRDPDTNEIQQWARDLGTAARALGAYIDRTPSGKGFHFILRGTKPAHWGSIGTAPEGQVGAFEMYDGGRYFTMSPHTAKVDPPMDHVGEFRDGSELWLAVQQIVGTKRQAPKATRSQVVVEHKAQSTHTTTAAVIDGQPRALARLERSVKAIVNAPEGAGNTTLNTEGFKVGQLVGGGQLAEQYARERLIAAGMLRKPTSPTEVDNVVTRSLRAGMLQPIEDAPTVQAMPSEIALAHEVKQRIGGLVCNVGQAKQTRWAVFVSHAGNDQGVWRIDDGARIMTGRQFVRRAVEDVICEQVPQSKQRIAVVNAVVHHLAESLLRPFEDFDNTPTLIGLGTVDAPLVCDLTTGDVRPMVCSDMCSKLTGVAPVDPQRIDGRLLDFIRGIITPTGQVMGDESQEQLEYVLDWLAYALFGMPSLHVLTLQGTARNGKGLLMQLALKAFGEYGDMMDGRALFDREVHPTAMMDMRGKRFLWHDEVDTARPLNAARVKAFTGGAGIKGRLMHGDYGAAFEATASIAMTTNTTLRFTNSDRAIQRRMPRVIMPNEYAEDNAYKAQILTLAGSLLRLLIDRAPRLHAKGPQLPPSLTVDAIEYAVADTHMAWLEDNLEIDPDGWVSYADLVDRRVADIRAELGDDDTCPIDRRMLKGQLDRDMGKVFTPNAIRLNARPGSSGSSKRPRGVGGVRWADAVNTVESSRDLPI